jgi:hypothetical protein
VILITGFPTIASDFQRSGNGTFFSEEWGNGFEESIRGVSHSSKFFKE